MNEYFYCNVRLLKQIKTLVICRLSQLKNQKHEKNGFVFESSVLK